MPTTRVGIWNVKRCNDIYYRIIRENELPENWLDVKEYLINEFTKNEPEADLLDKYLLLPVKRLLSTERWGYDRDGLNSISRPIDFDLSINTDKYNSIEKTEIVLILGQYACW
jgi:hypothetical protein